jgi:hypothetical protein
MSTSSDIEKSSALDDMGLAESSTPTQEKPPETLVTDPVVQPHQYAEGGFNGWMAVVGCFAVMFFTFGYMNAFGVYVPLLSTTRRSEESRSTQLILKYHANF